jgi:Leucine-rich repeat (LRR) protein
VAELDKVELFGVDLPPELKESRLTDAYVTLRLRPAAKDEDDDESSESNGDTDADTLPADAAFDRLLPAQKRVLIRGWAAIQAARGTSQERRSIPEYERTKDGDFRLLHPEEQIVLAAEWRRKMPFVITLRNCPDGKLPSPEQFPTQIGNEIGNPTPQWVQRLLHAGHGLILIDGIDEVSKQNHRELFGSIKRLCEAFPKNYFVLTTRPHAITGVRFEDLSFIATEVEPLEDNDRDLFIQHWFLAIASKLSLSAAKTQDLQQDAINLTKFISQTPWLAQLATTPLYCAMTCALFRHRRGTLPQGLRAMCETLCEMTVDRRDRERNLPLNTFPAEFGKLTYEQKKLLLRRLACHFVLAEKSTIQFPDAVEQVKKTLAGMLQRSERDAQAIFDGLLVRSGMLRLASEAKEDKPAIVEFVHNTFKEFLAGEQLADEANAGFLVKRLSDETWRRVGLFAIAAGTAKYQNDVLRELLQGIPEPLPKNKKKKAMTDIEIANTPRGKAIYVYRCGVLGNEWQSDVKERLTRLAKELFPPRTVTEAEWLSSAGNDVIPLLDVPVNENAFVVNACVRTLRLIGTPEAIKALAKYKATIHANVLAELAMVFPLTELTGIKWYLDRGFSLPVRVCGRVTELRIIDLSPNLKKLNLRETAIGNVMQLQHLIKLESLNLRGTAVVDVSPLQNLAQLQLLDLDGTAVTDVSPLQHLIKLESLDLRKTNITDVNPLQQLKNLKTLFLQRTAVVDISPLQHLTKLESLAVSVTAVADVSPLQHLKNLKDLYLSDTKITDVSPLQHLIKLETLDLRGTAVTDLSPLQYLKNLKYLYLSDTKITDFNPLQHLTQLHLLDLDGTKITDVSSLQHLKKLKRLSLFNISNVDLTPLHALVEEKGLIIYTDDD